MINQFEITSFHICKTNGKLCIKKIKNDRMDSPLSNQTLKLFDFSWKKMISILEKRVHDA